MMQNPESEIRSPKEIRTRKLDPATARWPGISDFELRPSVFGFILLLLFTSFAQAQQYSINWFTIEGGGGTSTGGVYQVSDTVGQPDAGPTMSGGNFSLTGGFWSLLSVVQTPGAPTLSIARGTPGNAIVSWNPNTAGFVLQETWSLSSANWTNSLSGVTNPVTVPANGAKYFRLIKTN
jgi:hypothetical protein